MTSAKQDYVQDDHMVRIWNKTLKVLLISAAKTMNFYAPSTKTVIFQDSINKYEKTMTIPYIVDNKSEVLRLEVAPYEVGFANKRAKFHQS